jgi:hypothetical protein
MFSRNFVYGKRLSGPREIPYSRYRGNHYGADSLVRFRFSGAIRHSPVITAEPGVEGLFPVRRIYWGISS